MASAGSTTPGELRPGNFIYFEGSPFTPPLTVHTVGSAGGGLAASGLGSATATVILKGTTQIINESITDSGIIAGAGIVQPGEQLSVTVDALQRPVNISASNNSGDRISVTALTVPQLAFSDGTLYWGRWTNASFFVDVQAPGEQSSGFGTVNVPAGSFVHYIFGIPAASVPLMGTATYTFMGGSGSTSVAGTVGAGVTGGTVTANFGGNFVSTNLTISHDGAYAASGFAPLGPGNRAQFSSIIGTATGPGGSHPFKFEGFFAGAPAPVAPPRAGMVWQINRPDAIVGTAAFRCTANC